MGPPHLLLLAYLLPYQPAGLAIFQRAVMHVQTHSHYAHLHHHILYTRALTYHVYAYAYVRTGISFFCTTIYVHTIMRIHIYVHIPTSNDFSRHLGGFNFGFYGRIARSYSRLCVQALALARRRRRHHCGARGARRAIRSSLLLHRDAPFARR